MKHYREDGQDWTELESEKDGIGGVMKGKMKYRKQDKKFEPGNFYAVVFFPRIDGLQPASASWGVIETLSNSPETAIAKFMDRLAGGETWETYAKAGHKVRRVQVSDLGPARLKRG